MGQRFSPAITAFSVGEIGPLAYGRVDLQEYNLSLRKCDNWLPTLQGPIVKRKGARFVATTLTNATARLIPYTGIDQEKFMLEFVENGTSVDIRVYDSNGVYTGDSVTWAFDPFFGIEKIQYAQKEDLLFIVHPNKTPFVFIIDSTGTPIIAQQQFNLGPLDVENTDLDIIVEVSAVSGTGLTVNILDTGSPIAKSYFKETDLLGLRCIPQAIHNQWVTGTAYILNDYVWSNSYESDRVNVYKCTVAGTSGTRAPGHDSGIEIDGPTGATWEMVHSEYGFLRIYDTGNPLDTHVLGDVVGFPEIPINYTSTPVVSGFRFSPGLWSVSGFASLIGDGNGPSTVTFHEQRVIYGGGSSGKQFIMGSKIDEFTNFYPGSLLSNAAYKYAINSSDNNDIRFVQSAKSLFVGTDNGLFSARASSGGAITPTDILIERSSNRGAKAQQSLQIGESVLFVQNGGITMREAIFNNDIKGFNANDLSILAHHLGELGLNRIAFQREPQTVIWTYSDAGLLIGLTYQREDGIVAWHQHHTGGDGIVEEVATLEDNDGVNDKLWMIVKRTIDGNTVRYIEIIDESQAWLDSYITYSGAPTTTITGLTHLEGETVKVVGDGAILPDEVVAAGQITLAVEVSEAVVGLEYIARAQTQKLEGGGQTGTSQGKSKRIHNVVLRLLNAGSGLLIGEDENARFLDRVIYRETDDPMDAAPPLFSGDTPIVPLDQNYESGGMIYLEHNLPNDCTVVALWPNMEVEDAR